MIDNFNHFINIKGILVNHEKGVEVIVGEADENAEVNVLVIKQNKILVLF